MIKAIGGVRDQTGLHDAGTEYIDTDDLQRVAAIGELRIELDHRARRGHLAQSGKCRIDRFVETAPRTSHVKIRIAREKLHAKRELVDCRTGNELYRVAERNPERDGEHRQHAARLVLRERSGKHELQRGYFCFVHQLTELSLDSWQIAHRPCPSPLPLSRGERGFPSVTARGVPSFASPRGRGRRAKSATGEGQEMSLIFGMLIRA